MYTTSERFKELLWTDGRESRITGEMVLKNRTRVLINNSTIAKSPEINNQCSGDSDLILGQAYQGQLKLSIYSDIDRYTVYGAKISLSYGLKMDDGSYEDIPLGVYKVNECIRTSNDILQITALDDIDLLDVGYNNESLSGTPYKLLQSIKKLTNIELGQSENDFHDLPNGMFQFGIPANAQINTYRDVVGDLSACLGGFATINRQGNLIIKSFSSEIVESIPAEYRKKETISDFQIHYTKVSCVKGNKYMFVGNDEGQELSLGANIFLQLGTDEFTFQVMTNILNELGGITFIPSSFDFIGDPALDVGDTLEITGYGARTSTIVPMHKTTWRWRGNHSVTAVGKNPYLNTKSKAERQIESFKTEIKGVENVSLVMNNGSDVVVSENWKQLGSINYSTGETQNILFNGVCKMHLITSGVVRFKYAVSGNELPFIHEVQMGAGINTATLFIPFKASSEQLNDFVVYVASDSAEGIVDALDFRGSISGTGLIENTWNGIIVVEDVLGRITIHNARVRGMSEELSLSMQIPTRITVEDILSRINTVGMDIKGFNERISITMKIGEYPIMTEDGEYILTEDGDTIYSKGGFIDG